MGWGGLARNPCCAMLGWIGLLWNGLPLLGWRLVARIGFDCIGQSWIGLNRMEQRWTGFSWLDDWILLAGSPKWAVLCWAVLGDDCNGQGWNGLTGLDKLLSCAAPAIRPDCPVKGISFGISLSSIILVAPCCCFILVEQSVVHLHEGTLVFVYL